MYKDSSLAGSLPGTRVLRAEVVHAVRMEMARSLEDVVYRRTDLGLGTLPEPALEEAARLMGHELRWTEGRIRQEVAQVSSSSLTVTSPVAERARAVGRSTVE